MATYGYANDYDQGYPPAASNDQLNVTPDGRDAYTFATLLGGYMSGGKGGLNDALAGSGTNKVFECPEALAYSGPTAGAATFTTYSGHPRLIITEDRARGGTGRGLAARPKIDGETRASDIALFFDGNQISGVMQFNRAWPEAIFIDGRRWTFGTFLRHSAATDDSAPVQVGQNIDAETLAVPLNASRDFRGRHMDNSVMGVAFADGHAESVNYDDTGTTLERKNTHTDQ